jgi:TusA-related sulfurtransferase/ketosteroid isomerase-like protein
MTEIALTRMVDALEARDRAALEGVFAQEVALRASLPRRDVERVGAAEASGVMLGWFADCTSVKRIAFDVGTVGDVWHVSYRFALRESEVDLVVEQHAYCRFDDGRISSIRLICSGFRPRGAHLHALGEGCATLTPRIATAIRALAPGQVLTVHTDDPAAPDGIAAWSRMTGHEIVAVTADEGGTQFQLRHK